MENEGRVAPRIVQDDASGDGASGEDVLGQADIEFKPAQHPGRDDSGDQDRRQHGRDHDVEKIVAGVEGGNGDHDGDQHVDDAGAGDVVVEGFAQALDGHAPRQVGDGDQSDQGGKQQRGRGQNHGGPDVAGIARDGRKKRCGEGETQAHECEQEFDPDFRGGGLQPLGQPTGHGRGRFQRIGVRRTHFFGA